MTSDFLTKQYVDHFLQAQIIQQLATNESPIRFSELKEDGVENSLFMYHANKLIDRGLIEKHQDGFQLTTKGARWVNYTGSNLLGKEILPRPLVQCIILSGDSILVAKRTGSMKSHLNEYMLPGGLHHAGRSALENIGKVIEDLFTEETPKPNLVTIAEAIITYDDGFVHHTISHIFKLSLPEQYMPKNNDKFEYQWFTRDSITAANAEFSNSQIVPLIIEKQSGLKHHEVFKLEQTQPK